MTLSKIFALLLFFSCAKAIKSNGTSDYDQLKAELRKVGYKSMSPDQQVALKMQLTEKLKTDSDYIKFNLASDDQTLALLNTGPKKPISNSSPQTDAELLTYYQEKGIKDPAKYIALIKEEKTEFRTVLKKYPELLFIGKEATSEVLSNSKSQRKLKFIPN